MPQFAHIRPGIRRLWSSDQPQLLEHFQRLDPETRRLRFGVSVSDMYLSDYTMKILSPDSVIFGAFPDDALRGVAELRGLQGNWHGSAELALLVEPAWQHAGIGDALLNRLIAAAQNRGVKTLHMMCLRENVRMRNLAKKHKAKLEVNIGEYEATIDPSWPTPMSVFEEMFGDTRSYLDLIFPQPR
ncbi:GNAT family N-acetyltransferase [Rhodobacteraceae bacterium KMM 6894]|nr:GNAT family N-acetyltransferase [Rhodobacteraceae bacterium KMM 6894]